MEQQQQHSNGQAEDTVQELKPNQKPTVCIVIGMAGSGKSTFMQRINAHASEHKLPSYFINLDPAVKDVSFAANIDIRDTVKYKDVMKEYTLGPNGAILTSLNLFATRFDQVINFVENKASQLKYVFLDTPGQIEIFTWSASGQIITETLASTFRTVVVYIVDTPRNTSPITFMSNMLYACSIMYKMQLPFLLVFNKIDVIKHDFALSWMQDFDSFQLALEREKAYSSSLAYSMSLVLDEFYKNLNTVGLSAVTGENMDQFFECVEKMAVQYDQTYFVELNKRKLELKLSQERKKKQSIEQLAQDLKYSKGRRVVADVKQGVIDGPSQNQEEEDEEDKQDEEELSEQEIQEFMKQLQVKPKKRS